MIDLLILFYIWLYFANVASSDLIYNFLYDLACYITNIFMLYIYLNIKKKYINYKIAPYKTNTYSRLKEQKDGSLIQTY